ncbi:MAG TPA: DUF2855 family protein [Solirubrobacteraceae bacterium]|nr:DUF2855 family protein [Solirubrobacteraceae bacterium]
MPVLEVRRDDLRATQVLGDDGGNVRIDRFGLTANNVTYGVMGDALSYWSFFPASATGWGRVPAWGVGELESGELIYGYVPMASSVRMTLDDELVERSEHRAALPATYNRYLPVAPDEPRLDEMLVLRPLFGTSFLLSDFLGGDDGTVVLGSASSKTAYGLAFLLDGPVVGLTSPRNREFVESLGVYDRVLTYDEVDALRGEEVVYVDMSGDGAVRDALHDAARVRRSVLVGATHHDRLGGSSEAEFFFAPAHIERMAERLGPEELQRRMRGAWSSLMGRVGDWMEIEHVEGADDVARVWRSLVDGHADPRRGYVARLG